MGDQVEPLQQTRVLYLNGQTIILQGDASDNSINEINSDILQEALQEVANSVDRDEHGGNLGNNQMMMPMNNETASHSNEQQVEIKIDSNDNNNFLAIFENEQGETQTVSLTLEQAAALGLQIEPEDHNDCNKQNNLNIEEEHVSKQLNDYTQNLAPNDSLMHVENAIAQVHGDGMQVHHSNSSVLEDVSSLLKDDSSMNLVPQYVNSTMAYSVKLDDPMNNHVSTMSLNHGGLQVSNNGHMPISSTMQSHPITHNTNYHSIPQSIGMNNCNSLLNRPKVDVHPIANKNVSFGQPMVRLKPPISNVLSPAILRPATTRTTIPKIQGTPTSMGNISISSGLPITSTASMVRVLNNPATSVPTVLNAKPATVTSDPIKGIDPNSVPSAAINKAKPLGSSENPIQLVQHGQTFHSMQPLSPEQLKQIATVLQQKQLDTSRNSKNVLYDANTNTRIIYRVVYPEDLALRKPNSSESTPLTTPVKRKKGRPPKVNLRKTEFDDDQSFSMELPKGEKEERKKTIPRTRSGRLSRPPRHMVKDYKRLHHLDFAEPDLDDSDGGYSDYQISDSEQPLELPLEETPPPAPTDVLNSLELLPTKRTISSKFRCSTCQKMYLGYSRMARHLEAFPDHGTMADFPRPAPPAPPPPVRHITGLEAGSSDAILEPINGMVKPAILRRRGRRRGIYATLSTEERSERRKTKLREMLVGCNSSEIAEVAGPMVAQALDMWQIMLLRAAAREDHPTRLAALCSELRPFLDKARAQVADVLAQKSHGTQSSSKVHQVEISDLTVASALGISCGVYNILDCDDQKLQCQQPSLGSLLNSLGLASTPQPTAPLDEVIHENVHDLDEPLRKKQRMWDDMGSKLDDVQLEKCFLDSTTESEKPSDTSMGSDTPLDDIVKAELKNLANKSGLDDFVAPPAPQPVTSQSGLALQSGVDFVATSYASTNQGNVSVEDSHFPADLVMDMPVTTCQLTSGHLTISDSSVPNKHHVDDLHFQLTPTSRNLSLDLGGNSMDVTLDSTHELDFEALSEEFNRNTQS